MNAADNYGWRAAVTDDWMRMGVRVHLARGRGEVVGFTEQGVPITAPFEPGVRSDFSGFALDRDAAEALAEALKPGPSAAELKRLEEALAIERARLDQVLDRLTPVVTMAEVGTPVSAVLESFKSDVPPHGWAPPQATEERRLRITLREILSRALSAPHPTATDVNRWVDELVGLLDEYGADPLVSDVSGEWLSGAWFEGWAAYACTGGDLNKVGAHSGCTCVRSGGELLRSDVPCPMHVELLDRAEVRRVMRAMDSRARGAVDPQRDDVARWVDDLEQIVGPA